MTVNARGRGKLESNEEWLDQIDKFTRDRRKKLNSLYIVIGEGYDNFDCPY